MIHPLNFFRAQSLLPALMFAFLLPIHADYTTTGNLTYAKVLYSRPPENLPETTEAANVRFATVRAIATSNGNVYPALTDASGAFSFSVSDGEAVDLWVYARGANVEVVSDSESFDSYSNHYKAQLNGAPITGGNNSDYSLTDTSVSGAYNIFDQLQRGRLFFESLGYTLPGNLLCVWSAEGTYFDPDLDILFIREGSGLSNHDPDEFDDDIILHEFGHYLIELLGRDDSQGGMHTVTDEYDLRLSWSEGLAHFISSAVRNNPGQIDALESNPGSTTTLASSFYIDDELHHDSGNEVAVANFLWNLWLDDSRSGEVFSAVFAMGDTGNWPSGTLSYGVTLDLFRDLYSATDISAHVADLELSYYNDDYSNYTSSQPFTLSGENQSLTGLSFHPQ
ncbi:MAG: hypothetical protein HQL31_04935, partial [Planctomycetes bacterium]|nr:hypothetical protein [Planctomycetota bacterium]